MPNTPIIGKLSKKYELGFRLETKKKGKIYYILCLRTIEHKDLTDLYY